MRYDRNSIDYEINIEALHELEEIVPMTNKERLHLRKWVRSGHEIDSNPWSYVDANLYPLSYLEAYRIRYGFPDMLWGTDTGSSVMRWDERSHSYISED